MVGAKFLCHNRHGACSACCRGRSPSWRTWHGRRYCGRRRCRKCHQRPVGERLRHDLPVPTIGRSAHATPQSHASAQPFGNPGYEPHGRRARALTAPVFCAAADIAACRRGHSVVGRRPALNAHAQPHARRHAEAVPVLARPRRSCSGSGARAVSHPRARCAVPSTRSSRGRPSRGRGHLREPALLCWRTRTASALRGGGAASHPETAGRDLGQGVDGNADGNATQRCQQRFTPRCVISVINISGPRRARRCRCATRALTGHGGCCCRGCRARRSPCQAHRRWAT